MPALVALVFFQWNELPTGAGLVINEVLARNRFSYFDEGGHSSDWLEIHNAGRREVDLTGYGLSDEPRRPHKWTFEKQILSRGEYLLVWCSGKDRQEIGGEMRFPTLHTNFRLGRLGQTVLLSRPNGELVDAMVLTPQTEDRSYGRSPDGKGDFLYYLQPTPGKPNVGPVSREPISSRPELSPPGGFFRSLVEVEINIPMPLRDFQIRYTTDGSSPIQRSRLYEGPIPFESSEWHEGTVLRAAAFRGEERVTQIETQSYFLDTRKFELPILSVAMGPGAFQTVQTHVKARGRTSEREGHVEFFNEAGARTAACGMGLRLHGIGSRLGPFRTKKSYRLYFRDVYGQGKLVHEVIPTSGIAAFDRLVLRSNTEDKFRDEARATFIRDQLMRELFGDMGHVTSHGAWYNLFVNMEYRGLYNVVERMDRFFFRSYFPEEVADWDVVNGGAAVDGDLVAWQELRRFFTDNDLRNDALYKKAFDIIDIDNYTDHMILNMWVQNHDWPHKNFFAARARRPGAKWIFLCWDGEIGFGLYPPVFDADSFERACTRGRSLIAEIFVSLLRSPRYQEYFLDKLQHRLRGVLHPDKVVARIERLRDLVAGDVGIEIQARYPHASMEAWQRNVEDMEVFARRRGESLWNHVFNSPRITLPHVGSVNSRRGVPGPVR